TRDRDGIAHHADGDALRERREPLDLGGAYERKADQDVVEAGVGHYLGLAELLTGDPARPRADLQPRDLRELVRLDMRAEGEPVLSAVALHAGDVPLDRVEVGGEHGRVERVETHARDRTARPIAP